MATGRRRANNPLRAHPPGDDLFARAIKLLATKPRSEAELRQLLAQRTGAPAHLIEACLARLKEKGLVNDHDFAYNYACHRLRGRPLGRSRLARELQSKGVAPEVIERALEAAFEEAQEGELIERAIDKYIRTRGRPQDHRGLRRMFDHLARLGFDRDLIASKLRSALVELDQE